MTKHERIVGFLLAGMTTGKVALRVGCRQSYVRAVRAREWGNGADVQRNYQNSLRDDPERLAKRRKQCREAAQRWAAKDPERTRKLWRDGYHRRKARAAQAPGSIARPSSAP